MYYVACCPMCGAILTSTALQKIESHPFCVLLFKIRDIHPFWSSPFRMYVLPTANHTQHFGAWPPLEGDRRPTQLMCTPYQDKSNDICTAYSTCFEASLELRMGESSKLSAKAAILIHSPRHPMNTASLMRWTMVACTAATMRSERKMHRSNDNIREEHSRVEKKGNRL